MTKNTIIFFILTLLSFPIFGQTKTDIEKDKLFGKVKSVYSYKVEYKDKIDTVLFNKEYYNENGMKLKHINYSEYSRIDSIVNTYDNKNRLLIKIEYESSRGLSSNEIEKSIDTTYYEYNNKCEDYAVLKNPKGTYRINYTFDENCRKVSETEIGRGNTNTTTLEYDKKGRVVKKTFTYLGEKANLYETFKYDDENNTLINIQFSPRYNVYYIKEVTQFNKSNKIIEQTTFQQELKEGSNLTTESQNVPDKVHKKVKYEYDAKNKLISETRFNGKNIEQIKVEIFYNENGELKEQKFYKLGKLEYREEYKYENGKKVEEKQFLPNKKTPEYLKTQRYNNYGQIIELTQLVDGDKYSIEYVYDSLKNEIEKKEYKNGKLIKTKFTEIEYYP